MLGFGSYLKDYLEFYKISQTEFASRLNITQKHMNQILNGKSDLTLEMVAAISKLTNIPISFIINAEDRKYVTKYLIEKYGSKEELEKNLKRDFPIKELDELKWITFKDKLNPIQNYIDIMNFLKVRDLEALELIQNKTLFKKKGTDLNKLNLWIARCDELSSNQEVNEYVKENFYFLVEDLKKLAYKKELELQEIQQLLNTYGIYFVVEKALKGSKVRGCFKVKNKNPAIYVTKNYVAKDSLYFEIFHELGHCKSDYNEAKSKVFVEGNEEQEKRADKFAVETMINSEIWEKIINNYNENNLLEISKKYKIPMSFIVGRLAKKKYIEYSGELYNKYKMN